MAQADPLDDAQLIYERAQAHIAAFNDLARALWQTHSTTAPDGSRFTVDLVLDRAVLREMKPVTGEIVGGLVHALDHVAGAARRSLGRDNPKNLYFPITKDDAAFEEQRKKIEAQLDAGWAGLFTELREAHRLFLPHLWLLKRMANSAKHWELVLGGADALAVAWALPGTKAQTIVQIPGDHFAEHDRFTFWDAVEPFPNVSILFPSRNRFEVEGAEPADAASLFSTSTRFVASVIEASRTHIQKLGAAL